MRADTTIGTSLRHGLKTLAAAATPEQMTTTHQKCVKVKIKAMKSNTGIVAVGSDNTVKAANDKSESGWQLDPGQGVDVEIDDPTKVWLDVATNGDGVVFLIVGV